MASKAKHSDQDIIEVFRNPPKVGRGSKRGSRNRSGEHHWPRSGAWDGDRGISQVMIIGGESKQFQVLVDPGKLADYGLTLDHVVQAAGGSNANASGGFLERPNQEFLIRARARVYTPEDLGNSVITVRDGTPILVKNVATVQVGAALKRGDGSFNGAGGGRRHNPETA
jgi:hypothetical protein